MLGFELETGSQPFDLTTRPHPWVQKKKEIPLFSFEERKRKQEVPFIHWVVENQNDVFLVIICLNFTNGLKTFINVVQTLVCLFLCHLTPSCHDIL